MFKLEKYPPRSYWELMDFYREELIYMFYLGDQFCINKFINSPFKDRQDSTPSFRLNYKNNMLLWHDFGDFKTGYPKSIVGFVMRYLGIESYPDAINQIMRDMEGFEIHTSIMKEVDSIRVAGSKASKKGIVVKKKFDEWDLDFWKGLSIPGVSIIDEGLLRFYDTLPISEVYIEGKLWRKSSKYDPIFAYILNKTLEDYAFQLYRPLSESRINKFRSHNIDGQVFGLSQLPTNGETLIITKSCKDVIVLKSLGFWAICPFSEASYIHLLSIIPKLLERFNNIYIMYDPDPTGIGFSSLIVSQFEGALTNILIPEEFEKDPSDNITKGKGLQFLEFLKTKTI